jgi:DNA repair protein SbcC/Rad50
LIIEQAIPALEDEANRLLHKITGGRFTLRIDSLRVLKSGGMKESLEVIVADEVSERPLEALSGGERQCVDLSLRISLARLLAHRAGRSIETLIIDEGFTALDVVHRQRTIEVLHELLEEFTCVLFVTHLQELADAFPARLEITRDENGSHVNAGVPEAVSA